MSFSSKKVSFTSKQNCPGVLSTFGDNTFGFWLPLHRLQHCHLQRTRPGWDVQASGIVKNILMFSNIRNIKICAHIRYIQIYQFRSWNMGCTCRVSDCPEYILIKSWILRDNNKIALISRMISLNISKSTPLPTFCSIDINVKKDLYFCSLFCEKKNYKIILIQWYLNRINPPPFFCIFIQYEYCFCSWIGEKFHA